MRTEGRLFHLLGAALVLMLISLSTWGTSPVGEYLDPLIPDNILEIDSDGSFYIEVFGLNVGETGHWTTRGEQVSLRFADGTTLRGVFDSTSVVFDPMPMLTLAWVRSSAPFPKASDLVGEFAKEGHGGESIRLNSDMTYTKTERDMFGQMAQETGDWQLDGHVVRLTSDNTFFDVEVEAVYAGGHLFLPDFLAMSKWTRQSSARTEETPPPVEEDDLRGGIAGSVVDARSRNPIAQALVRVDPSKGVGDLASGPRGTFHVEVDEGSYVVSASASGYAEAQTNVVVAGGETVNITLALEPGPSWRQDLEIGDILYDPCVLNIAPQLNKYGFHDTLLGHIGIFVGNNETVDPGLDSIRHPLSNWDDRDQVRILRVRCPTSNPDCREDAAEWALALADELGALYSYQWPVIDSIFSGNHQKSPDADESEWYCSELVWAAFFNQGVDVEAFYGNISTGRAYLHWLPVSPDEICEDGDTWQIGGHVGGVSSDVDQKCGCSAQGVVRVYCPVDLQVTGSDGRLIGRDTNRWPGASYWIDDFDGDGVLDAEATFPETDGAYEIRVIPWASASPEDEFTLVYIGPDTSEQMTIASAQQLGEQMDPHVYRLRIRDGATMIQSGDEPLDESAEPAATSGERLPAGETLTLPLRRVLFVPAILIAATLLAVMGIAVRTRKLH